MHVCTLLGEAHLTGYHDFSPCVLLFIIFKIRIARIQNKKKARKPCNSNFECWICKLQEIYSGGVPETDLLILRKIAEADDKANLRQTAKIKKLTRGTRLVKEWKGKCYSVTATGDGRFEYDGETYRSLSAVADKITGTHWNGKKFFGVE